MILLHEGATLPLVEMELPKEPMDVLTLAGSKPLALAMVGHRPVFHCASGETRLPLPKQSYPSWLDDELLALKSVGA